jgi:hypothetical protein
LQTAQPAAETRDLHPVADSEVACTGSYPEQAARCPCGDAFTVEQEITMTLSKLFGTVAICATLAAGGAFASEDAVSLTDDVRAQITSTLTEQGYEVGKIKTDDGMYEAYARKDGKKYEIYMNAKMEIVKTKVDD